MHATDCYVPAVVTGVKAMLINLEPMILCTRYLVFTYVEAIYSAGSTLVQIFNEGHTNTGPGVA